MFELNWALMSLPLSPGGNPGSPSGVRSTPASLHASASWYQKFENSAFGKPNSTKRGPAEPSTAVVAVQVSGLNAAWIWMGTVDGRMEPQKFAARTKQLSRG